MSWEDRSSRRNILLLWHLGAGGTVYPWLLRTSYWTAGMSKDVQIFWANFFTSSAPSKVAGGPTIPATAHSFLLMAPVGSPACPWYPNQSWASPRNALTPVLGWAEDLGCLPPPLQ